MADYGNDFPGTITVNAVDASKQVYMIEWTLPDKAGVSASGTNADLKFQFYDKSGQIQAESPDAQSFLNDIDNIQ